jgi:hypothetical protein
MADNPKPEVAAKPARPVRLLRSKDFRAIFSNTFRIRNNGYDVGVAFGYQSEIPSGPVLDNQSQAIITDEVEVVLTPAALKLFYIALSQNIEAIEAVTGKPIELPQAMLDQMVAQKSKLIADLEAELNPAPATAAKS